MKWYENLKTSRKLIIGFLIVAIIAAAVGVIGILNNLRLSRSSSQIYSGSTLAAEYAGETGLNFQQFRYDAIKLSAIDLSKPEVSKPVTDEMTALIATVTDGITKLDGVVKNPEIVKLTDELQASWKTYSENMTKVIEAAKKNDTAYIEETKPANSKIGAQIRDQYQQLLKALSEDAAAEAAANEKISHTSVILISAVSGAGIIMSIVLGLIIARMIARPIDKVVLVTSMLADGDINIEPVLTPKDKLYNQRKDEIGMLARSIDKLVASTVNQVAAATKLADGDLTVDMDIRSDNDMLGKALAELVQRLNQIVGAIIGSASQVESGSSLVSHSSMALSQGATEQASAIQQLTASIEEVASQTNRNAENAGKVDEISRSAKANAAGGNERMKDMLAAMEDINESSGKIGKIIKVIDDIAFQTNILALNAAVEAARAGQHGKGFAVVAEEVRTLAAKSANAARETTDLIENSIRKVEAGTKIASETADALSKIVTEVDRVAGLVTTIVSASNEQAVSIEQINTGVSQISQVVQTNAATAEESAAASEELSGQAAQLKETISMFRLKDSRDPVRRSASQINLLPKKAAAPSLHNSAGFGKY